MEHSSILSGTLLDERVIAKALIERISSRLKGIFGGFRETAYTYLTKR